MPDLEFAVQQRLTALGFQSWNALYPQEIAYQTRRCRAALLAALNQTEVPDALFYVLVDMIAGAYLQDRLASGSLEIDGMDFTAPAKSITEGDVKVEFASASDGAASAEARFLAKVDAMAHPPEAVLSRFRRLSW